MNNYDLITVVVPVYNVKNFLEKCVDSIIDQTYKNIEILLIDDGSSDGSESICDEYAINDSRVRSFHKQNGGLADARNYGIDRAQGKYITFVDSDDWIDQDFLELLYNSINDKNAEISVCDFRFCYDGQSIPDRNWINSTSEVLDTESALNTMIYANKFASHATNKMYLSSLFKDIRFPKGKYYEDLFTIYKIVARAHKVVYINAPKYNYCIRMNSISTSTFSLHHMDYIEASQNIVNFCIDKHPKCQRSAYFNYQRNVMQTIDKYLISRSQSKELESELYNDLDKYYVRYECSNSFERKYYIKKILLKHFKNIYKVYLKLREK